MVLFAPFAAMILAGLLSGPFVLASQIGFAGMSQHSCWRWR
jgi:hypothetical protein